MVNTIRSQDIDGPTVLEVEADVIDDLTDNKLDRAKLKTALRNIQAPTRAETKDADGDAKDPAEKATSDASTRRISASGKHFVSFLSHFKRECGTEARLVCNEMKHILPEDNNDVFLDSGERGASNLMVSSSL